MKASKPCSLYRPTTLKRPSIVDFTEQPLFQGPILELTLFWICPGFDIM